MHPRAAPVTAPPADATADMIRAACAALKAINSASAKTWEHYEVIGEAVAAGRSDTLRVHGLTSPKGRRYSQAFGSWLTQNGLSDDHGLEKGDRTRLLQLMEHLPEVNAWRATLPDKKFRSLNNPSSVWRAWPANPYRKPRPPRAAREPMADALRDETQRADVAVDNVIALEDENVELTTALAAAIKRADDAEAALSRAYRVDQPVCTAPPKDAKPAEDDISTLRAIVDGAFHPGNTMGDAITRIQAWHRKTNVSPVEALTPPVSKTATALIDLLKMQLATEHDMRLKIEADRDELRKKYLDAITPKRKVRRIDTADDAATAP